MFSLLEVPSNVIIKKVYTFLFFNTLIVESNTDKLSAIGIINQQHSPTNHNDNTEFDHTALGLYHVYVNNISLGQTRPEKAGISTCLFQLRNLFFYLTIILKIIYKYSNTFSINLAVFN